MGSLGGFTYHFNFSGRVWVVSSPCMGGTGGNISFFNYCTGGLGAGAARHGYSAGGYISISIFSGWVPVKNRSDSLRVKKITKIVYKQYDCVAIVGSQRIHNG